jgi:hypothetical protein
MEFIEELMSELPLSEFRSVVHEVFLGNWDVQFYYEAMGLDWDEEDVDTGNENDNLS